MPALQLLAMYGPLTTPQLASLLRQRVIPKPGDLERLPSRKDDRLSQVIRNLISHRTLEKRGLATYTRDPITQEASYALTDLGQASVDPNHTPTYR